MRWLCATRDRAMALVATDCPLCAGHARAGQLCHGCRADVLATMHPAQPRCPRCALRLRADDGHCPDCQRRAPALDRAVAGFDYESPGDMLIARYKAGRRIELADVLAQLILARPAGVERGGLPAQAVLVPIPAARKSLRRRGFNPAGELARALAHRTGLPLRRGWLVRTREGPKQTSLGRSARTQGAIGAYACSQRLPACAVALVDDVMTTGSTLHAAALALRAAGAVQVVGVVAARAPAGDGGALAQYRLP